MTEERYKEIISIPEIRDSIILKLEHIRRYLNAGKASVMVGAGFSKNAKKANSVIVKDWNELNKDFIDKIYTKEEQKNLSNKNISPLHMASLVEAAYGRHELENIIQTAVPDESLSPSELHKALVGLNWRDIFTMNYDTLIERAAQITGQKYEIVTTKETLYYQATKRIIKLHGSYPNAKPYIITEEDYRCYPENYPEFINTIRQALLETVFCLVGFSGEDPNFLEWLGWIRDIMGDRMSPVYMFNVDTSKINEAEMALMKERKINIIQKPKSLSINEFYEFIFKFLLENDNLERWHLKINLLPFSQQKNLFDSKIEIENYINNLRSDRLKYPGWIIVKEDRIDVGKNGSTRDEIKNIINGIYKIEILNLKIDFLYEIDWRLRMNFTPINLLPDYEKFIEDINEIEYENNEDLFKKILSLKISLLKIYRLNFEINKFKNLKELINTNKSKLDLEDYNRFNYECCLFYSQIINYEGIGNILEEWHPTKEDYQGIIWKGVILIEIGELKNALSLLLDGKNYAQRVLLTEENPEKENSAINLIDNIINALPFDIKLKYLNNIKVGDSFDFYKYIDFYKSKILSDINSNEFRDSEIRRIHNFNLSNITNSISMDGNRRADEIWLSSSLFIFWETYGYPFGFPIYSINRDAFIIAIKSLLNRNNNKFGIQYFIRCGKTDIIEKNLIREYICNFPKEFVNELSELFISKWNDNFINNINSSYLAWRYNSVILILLSRLTIFSNQDLISKIISIIFKIYKSGNNGDYYEVLLAAINSQDIKGLNESLRLCLHLPIINPKFNYSYKIPYYQYISPKLDSDSKSIALEGLRSNDLNISNDSYIRIAQYYSSFKSKKIDEEVVRWRNKNLFEIVNTAYSFNLIPYGSTKIEESLNFGQIFSILYNEYININQIENNKEYITAFNKLIDYFIPIGKFLEREENEKFVNVVVKFLEENKTIYENNIHKTSILPLYDKLQNEFKKILSSINSVKLELVRVSQLKKLEVLLIDYNNIGYPTLYEILKLNLKTDHLDNGKIYSKIEDNLCSSNENFRNNALQIITFFNNEEIKEIWRNLFFSFKFMDSKDLSLYVSSLFDFCTLNKISYKELNLKEALENINNNISRNKKWSADDFDIQNGLMKILGYYFNQSNCDLSLLNFNWKEDLDSIETPNDVKQGFYQGEALYKLNQ